MHCQITDVTTHDIRCIENNGATSCIYGDLDGGLRGIVSSLLAWGVATVTALNGETMSVTDWHFKEALHRHRDRSWEDA